MEEQIDEKPMWCIVANVQEVEMSDRVEAILALLDEGWGVSTSPMDFDASESHFRAAGQRMSVFRSEEHWVVLFEQVRYSVGEDAFEVALWAYGDCLSPECTDRYHGMSHARPFELCAETTFIDPECQSWRHDRARFCIWRNGKRECFSPTPQEYAAAGIVFESPKTGPDSLAPEQLLQFLCHHLDHPFFASEDYLRRWIDSNIDFSVIPYPQVSVSPTLSLLLQTRHWHHPDLAISECPSQLESFHILARAIVSGDLTEWHQHALAPQA